MSDATTPPVEMRKKLRINPVHAVVNYGGQTFKEVFIRLPAGMISDDLKEPEIFATIQDSPKALRKFDRVVLVSSDETWMAEAYVESADSGKVLLARPRIITLSERSEKLFSDGTYAVRWSGVGYDVVRLRDNAVVSGGHPNPPLAERALSQMYAKRA